MKEYREGDWYCFEERTTRSFEHVRFDMVRMVMSGLAGIVSNHEWNGKVLEVSSPGAVGKVSYESNRIITKVKPTGVLGRLFHLRIMSDVKSATALVSGAIGSENRDVFIVHGHDDQTRRDLQRFLTSLQIHPIVLEEQDDRGLTIVEKFEYYAATSGFAFVLMTPDDKSTIGDDEESKWRARQNVIMELGWFMARLGRERVVLLLKGNVEIPSDIFGVVYVRFENNIGEITERIRQRLKGVGILP